jgi:hypothetical protein
MIGNMILKNNYSSMLLTFLHVGIRIDYQRWTNENDNTPTGGPIMWKMEQLIDSFERTMAAVAFAERNDRETACWIMQPDPSSTLLRVAEESQPRVARQPEMRL